MSDLDHNTTPDCCAVNADEPTEPKAPTFERQKEAPAPKACPQCGHKGRKVDTATVKALLAVSLRQVRDVAYLFCRNPVCEVVYFSEDGLQTFSTAQVRERVYQKETLADDVFVCYCFRHTRGEIREELERSGTTTVIDDVNAGIKAGQCACDWRNPQGSCCLGNVRALVQELEAALGS